MSITKAAPPGAGPRDTEAPPDEAKGVRGRATGLAVQLAARPDHAADPGGLPAGADPPGGVRAGDAELDDGVRRRRRTGPALPRPRGAAVGDARGVRTAVVLRPCPAQPARSRGAGRGDGRSDPARLRVRVRAGGRRAGAAGCRPGGGAGVPALRAGDQPDRADRDRHRVPRQAGDGRRPVRREPARGVRDGLALAAARPHRLAAPAGPSRRTRASARAPRSGAPYGTT